MELFNEDIIPKRTLGEIVSLDNVITNQSIVNGAFKGGIITIGSNENVFKVDRNGIYLGASSFSVAPFRVDMQGNMVASSATIAGDIVSDNYVAGVSGYKLEYSTGNGYFNQLKVRGGSNSYFISDTIDTSSKYILKDFSFSPNDYSGAFKTGDITWNSYTGEITGGSGGLFNKKGLIFANNGNPTIVLDGTTGKITSFALDAGTITGVTITGGTIQTAISGQRIRILSEIGTSPSQQANSLSLIDDNGNSILNFGTETGIIMAIRPRTDNNSGLIIQTDTDVSYSGNLFVSDIQYEYSTGIAGYFENIGSGECVKIQTDGTGVGLLVTTAGEKTSSTDVVRIDSNKNGDALKINKSTNSGRGLFINMTGANNNYQPMYIYNQGLSGSQITQTNSNADSALLIEQSHAGVPPLSLQQYTSTNQNFKATLSLSGTMIWVSNGTSPNGSLSGYIGDICINADSGKVYRCSGGTSWTAL